MAADRARTVYVLASLVVALHCSREPEIEERAIVVYSPRACPVSQSEAFSVIYAGGDFEATVENPPIASVFLRELGRTMQALPKESRSIVVDVSQNDVDWRGFSPIRTRSGPINVLVWPGGETCRLTRDVERRTRGTLGVVGQHFIVAGGQLPTSQVPHTYVGDLGTGVIERLPFGLKARRSYPTITPFRTNPDDFPSPALVAGGEDPETGAALADAELYMPAPNGAVGDFERDRIALSEARTRHGAVALATGETLLVGGVGLAGPLRTMEIIDPVTRRARTAGVALLQVARANPTVLRLASGEILIAGGIGPQGNEVPTLEWFAPDASRPTKRSVDLVTGRARSLVALEAGGALAVIAPKEPNPEFKTVWVISADGTVEPALPIDPATLDIVRLFPGAEGAPALWTGQRWLRWSPWFGAFENIADAPATGPTLDVIANGDSGLALWLDDRVEAGMNVTGFRFATRTQWDAVPKPLLVTGTEQLAPDRLASSPASALRFTQDRGLLLGQGSSVFVTDVTFADFELEVEVTAAPPIVVLRSDNGGELEVGGQACALTQTATKTIKVKRRARRVDVRVDDQDPRTCPTELSTSRVALGLRGSGGVGVSGARNLIITRR